MASIPYENVNRLSPLDQVGAGRAKSDGEVTLPFDQILQQAKPAARRAAEPATQPSRQRGTEGAERIESPPAAEPGQDEPVNEQPDAVENQDSDAAEESARQDDSSEEDNGQEDGSETDAEATVASHATESTQEAKAELELAVNAALELNSEADGEDSVQAVSTDEGDSQDGQQHLRAVEELEIEATAEFNGDQEETEADDGDTQKIDLEGPVTGTAGTEVADQAASNGEEETGTSNRRRESPVHAQQVDVSELNEVAEATVAPEVVQAAAASEGQSENGRQQRANNDRADQVVETVAATEDVVEAVGLDADWTGGDRRNRERREDPSQEQVRPSGPVTSQASNVPATKGLSEQLLGQAQDARGTQTLNDADQARFMQRVARAFQTAQDRNGAIRLRLHPPELGSMRLEVKMQGGVMTARLETETNMARSVLMESLPVLRERLEEQGIRVENFDIDLMDRSLTGEMPEDDSQNQTDDSDNPTTQTETAESDESPSGSENEINRGSNSAGLNVVV